MSGRNIAKEIEAGLRGIIADLDGTGPKLKTRVFAGSGMKHEHEWEMLGAGGGNRGPTTESFACFCGATKHVSVQEPENPKRRYTDAERVERRKASAAGSVCDHEWGVLSAWGGPGRGGRTDRCRKCSVERAVPSDSSVRRLE